MIIVDRDLQTRHEEGNPIRVGMIGAGFMGKGIAFQIIRSTPGMELVAIANRTLKKTQIAYEAAGISNIEVADNLQVLEHNILKGKYSITENPDLLCAADQIDAIIEVTGTVEESARLVLKAFAHRKHVIRSEERR